MRPHPFFTKKTFTMNAEKILTANILDIIFEKRNKAYGAYELRSHYGHRMYKAIGIIFISMALLCMFLVLYKNNPDVLTTISFEEPVYTSIVQEELKSPEIPAVPSIKQPAATPAVFTPTIVSNSAAASSGRIVFDDHAQPITGIGDGPVPDPFNPPADPGDAQPLAGPPASKEPSKPVIDKETPMKNPDIMPSFPGGEQALRRYLEKNISRDLSPDEEVTVKVRFVVGYDGKLKSFQLVEDGGAAFNEEVMSVLKKMPDWIPGKSNGESVSVIYMIPVKFSPTGD